MPLAVFVKIDAWYFLHITVFLRHLSFHSTTQPPTKPPSTPSKKPQDEP